MLSSFSKEKLIGSAALCGLALLVPHPGTSQLAVADPTGNGDKSVINVEGPERTLYPLAIPSGVGPNSDAVRLVSNVATFNMQVAGSFRVLNAKAFRANLKKEGMQLNPLGWKETGAFGVMKYRVTTTGNEVTLQTHVYEVEKGDRPVFSKTYTGRRGNLRRLVHKWCNDVVFHFTGQRGFFGSKIAFVAGGKRGKKVYAMDFDGHRPYRVTRNRSINILPSWSPSGGQIAFTSYMRNNPDMYVVRAGGGRPRRISKYPGMNTGASWSPDGSKIALTLSRDGNPEIYIVSATSGAIIKRLTYNRAIDTSPTWSPSGSEIAFVSDREGGPQIFVMSADGSGQRRVSKNGNYNTTPTWSPRRGARVLAYTTRDGGNYDIVTLDLVSGAMVRITQGQGNNEEPSFSPNGQAIAFASTGRSSGSGIYIALANGKGLQRRVYKGRATSIDWGPAP